MVMLKVAKRFMIAASLVAMSAGAGVLVGFKNTNGLSRACRNSAACMEAVAREEEANAKAESAISSANWYQVKVNELSASIARKTAEIAETEANIKELEVKIANAEAELAEKQDALASLLIDMHFDGDTEPITLLAGSSSLSDLAEKQAREEVIKQEIAAAAELIKQTKAELEAGTLKVFATANWTVKGEHLTEYLADVQDMGDFQPETNVILDGAFVESGEQFRSAPYFDIRIDGITEK